MSAAGAFCRLVLGETASASAAAANSEPDVEPTEAVARAWLACAPELERRRVAFAWEEPAPPADATAVRLEELGELERAAVAAEAVGLTPVQLEQALATQPGAAAGLLARAHAGLAGLGLPADAADAAERERLAVARRPRSRRPDGRVFAKAVTRQRAELRAVAVRAGTEGSAPTTAPQLSAAESAPPPPGEPPRPRQRALRSDRLRRRALAVAEPASRGGRAAVAGVVLVLGALVGFGAVSVLERDGAERPGVVTATPVGPLPPGVGPTDAQP